jgi:hypothetical protein
MQRPIRRRFRKRIGIRIPIRFVDKPTRRIGRGRLHDVDTVPLGTAARIPFENGKRPEMASAFEIGTGAAFVV